jgi:hypothetical protein
LACEKHYTGIFGSNIAPISEGDAEYGNKRGTRFFYAMH